ncbi:MAG: hypothetical protein JWO36_588 [Myxococcales bacterium]|nr:hypothetical protein [Myxococcales bacterium]
MRKTFKWIGRILLGVLGLVVLTIGVALIVLHTDWGRERVRRQVVASLQNTFTGGATIGRIDGSPFTDLILRDLVINGPDLKPAITIGTLRVHVSLWPLLSHDVKLGKLVADDVEVLLKREATGDLMIKHLTKPGPSSNWSVYLDQVEIHRGHVMFETGPAGTDAAKQPIDLDGIQLDARADLPHGGPTAASLVLQGTWRQKAAPLTLAAALHIDDERVAINGAFVKLGDLSVAVAGGRIPKGNAKLFSGSVAVFAPANQVAALFPQVQLPADVALAIEAVPAAPFTQLAIAGTVGRSPLRGFARADLAAKSASGLVIGDGLDLGQLSNDKVTGIGGVLVAFDVLQAPNSELPTAHAMITTWGEFEGTPHSDAVIALDTSGDRIRAVIGATGVTGFRAAVAAELHRKGEALTLDRGVVIASTRDASAATGGKAPLHGLIDAKLSASGALSPQPDLAIAGFADGSRLRIKDISAATFHLRIDGTHLPSHPVGSARVEIADLVRQDVEITKLTLAAGNRPDGKVQVSLRSQPKHAPTRVDVDALVTPGDNLVVDLQRHIVRAAGGNLWTGTTGHLVVSKDKIELTDLKSTSGDGKIALDASYVRAGAHTGDLDAKLDGGIELSNVSNTYRGRIDASVDVQRRAGKFSGVVATKVRNLSSDESVITLDVDGKVEARGGKLTAGVTASSPRIGTASLALDVAAPEDITKAAQWRRLGREAIRTGNLKLHDIDLGSVADLADVPERWRGKIDGEIQINDKTLGGLIQARGIHSSSMKDAGAIDAELRVAQNPKDDDEIMTTLTAAFEGLGRMQAEARFYTPERLFDPVAWKAQGIDAFHGASIRTDQIAFEPGTLERFGVFTNLRGKVALQANLERGLQGSTITVDARDLRGGPLSEPIAVHFDAEIGSKTTRGLMFVRTNDNKVTLLELRTNTPITMAELRGNPQAVKEAELRGSIVFPQVPATALLHTIGTGQATGGIIDGSIELGGTIGRPTATAAIFAHGVTVPPGAGAKAVVMKELRIDGTWDGAAGKLAIKGIEQNGGTIDLTADARLDALKEATGRLQASKLDISPLVAFMPGPAGGLGGLLDADLNVHGLDPRTAEIAGTLAIREGRFPIAPAVGTLFHGDLQVNIVAHTVDLKMKGKLGKGDVELAGKVPLDGYSPKGGKATLNLRKVKLIGTTEPEISAVVTADLARVADQWKANIAVNKAFVSVPEEKGTKLAPAGAPNDLVYGGQARTVKDPTQIESNSGNTHRIIQDPHPAAVAEVAINDAWLESKEVRGFVSGKLEISLGAELGVTGDLALKRGDLDLFDRRYTVDRAILHFDGNDDPIVDIRITYDFPDVTTVTEIHGRMSHPQLQLSSTPAIYSQSELLGFLLGGEPGGDPRNAPSASEKVAGAGASIIANQIGGYVKKALPVDIDVLRYEAASATSSAAVEVGTWISRKFFVAYRQRLAARVDENTGEAEIEYWFRRRFVFEGVVGDRGKDGLDLLWRRRW